jgi:hypothetical protein
MDLASDGSVTYRGDKLVTHQIHSCKRNGLKEDDLSPATRYTVMFSIKTVKLH